MFKVLPFLTQYTSLISENDKLPPILIDVQDTSKLNFFTTKDINLLNSQRFIIKDNAFNHLVDCDSIINDSIPFFEKESKTSKMGEGELKWQNAHIRGDKVWWINSNTITPHSLGLLVDAMKQIQTELNQATNLNSEKSESHFTCYPGKGSGYIRHLDATTKSHSNRKITCLFYLNKNWKKGDGGELLIYNETNQPIKVEPISNRLLIFQSGSVEHQVLPTNVDRFAYTLWLC